METCGPQNGLGVGHEGRGQNEAKTIKPCVGQEFECEDRAWEYYNDYGKQMGFSIRKGQRRIRSSTGDVVWRRYVCSREGYSRSAHRNDCNDPLVNKAGKRRQSNRVGCVAEMVVSRKREGSWTVVRFVDQHSHPLAAAEECLYLRSHRKVNRDTHRLLDDCRTVGIGPSKAYDLASAIGRRGVGNNFTRGDVKNYMCRSRKGIIERDAQCMFDYLKAKQNADPSLFVSDMRNEKGQLMHIFWADGRSRLDFKVFSDVLCFDTTYKTNRYKMPFAPFVGINHHKQTTVFGCALMSDECFESFTWLFNQFKAAVGGASPVAIITDQDAAITQAITVVFPEAVHKFCLWHILRKIPEKLGCVYNEHSKLKDEFEHLIYQIGSIDEFEVRWPRFLQSYDLQSNSWLSSLYDIREKWVPVFQRSTRFMGMCTNQRSEAFHAILDGYITRRTCLLDFVKHFDKLLTRRRQDEVLADKRTRECPLVPKTSMAMEKSIFEQYTCEFYRDTQIQMWESSAYNITKLGADEDNIIYEVNNPSKQRERRIIEFNILHNFGTCTCLMWESTGIVCRHLFALMRTLHMQEIPPSFILQRMCRDPRRGILLPKLQPHSATVVEDRLMACFRHIHMLVVGKRHIPHYAYHRAEQLLNEVQHMIKVYDGNPVITPRKGAEDAMDMDGDYSSEDLKNPPLGLGKGRPDGSTMQRRLKKKKT